MAQIDDFLILPVSELDELLAKFSAGNTPIGTTSHSHVVTEFSSIDELGLLPGSHDTKSISGIIPLDEPARFASIEDQTALTKLDLKSNGTSLVYQLANQDQEFIATAGDGGKAVFTAEIKPDGYFQFTLNQQIDRATAPNLVREDAWHNETKDNTSKMSQLLLTEPNMPYQFTLHYAPQDGAQNGLHQLQVFWDNQLLQTIQTSHHDARGYTFSVEGSQQGPSTLLEVIGLGAIGQLSDHIQDMTVVSTAQFQLPLDFAIIAQAEELAPLQALFTVNITTTPAIELNNDKHFDIFYEQSVYQTIIVNDQNITTDPLATINLDSLFKQLAIEQENRLVEVVQRTEDGMATNVYEIQISDKEQTMEPITIADVQLSFPGGNGGVEVFSRTIAIDEGSAGNALPPLLDMV